MPKMQSMSSIRSRSEKTIIRLRKYIEHSSLTNDPNLIGAHLLQWWRDIDSFAESITWHGNSVHAVRLQTGRFGAGNIFNNCDSNNLHTLQLRTGEFDCGRVQCAAECKSSCPTFTRGSFSRSFFLPVQVKCAHTLYKRTRRTEMSFAEVAETAFANGPKWGRGFARLAKVSILQCLFWTYFGTCSVYTVIIAKNFQQIAEHYYHQEINIRICIAALLIPLILLSWVPNLKYLAPVSMIANGLMGIGLGITFYYLVFDLPDVSSRPMVGNLMEFPVNKRNFNNFETKVNIVDFSVLKF